MIRNFPRIVVACLIGGFAAAGRTEDLVPKAAPKPLAFDTVEEITAMPSHRATVKSRTPCSVDLATAEGSSIHLGSPKAPAEVIQFLVTLQGGQTYDLPDAFIAFQAFQPLERTLTPIIQKYFPDAQFSKTNTEFVAKHGTMEFLVHGGNKTGEFAPEPRREEGPNYRGFLLQIQVLDDRFPMAAAVPQEIRHPYWTTFLDSAPLPGTKFHFLIGFSYGSRLDPVFRETIRAALPSSLPPRK
jgi:hypothetical protein